jgi:hypothetical protein
LCLKFINFRFAYSPPSRRLSARHLPSLDRTSNMTSRADRPSGTILHLARCQVQPSSDFSASPDDEFGPRMNSPPCLSSPSATYSAANLADGHSAKLWRTSRDGSSDTSARLSPCPSRAPTSINAAVNLDVISRKDTNAPCKQAFSPYPDVVTTTTVRATSSPGARTYGQPLGLCLGSQQETSGH